MFVQYCILVLSVPLTRLKLVLITRDGKTEPLSHSDQDDCVCRHVLLRLVKNEVLKMVTEL